MSENVVAVRSIECRICKFGFDTGCPIVTAHQENIFQVVAWYR